MGEIVHPRGTYKEKDRLKAELRELRRRIANLEAKLSELDYKDARETLIGGDHDRR